MSRYLDGHLADTLCTIIAIGFIADQKDNTTFVYENVSDEPKHRELERILADRCKINIRFKLAASQDIEPFIIGQTRYIYGDKTPQQIADDFMTKTNIIQVRFNEQIKGQTPGAYIGCIIGLDKIEFDSPSELYLYEPQYRNREELDSVKNSYDKARDVSDILNGFLNTNLPLGKLKKSERIREHQKGREYKEGHLFASCHGMVLAIYDYGYHLVKENLCAELALGRDTRKVASCIPCSLFMSANGFPASATHLGRGDNWNYPSGEDEHPMTKAWKNSVCQAYQSGLQKTGGWGMEFTRILVDGLLVGNDPEEEIPRIFLESLTFEGSFADKIFRTLTRYPGL